MKKISIYFVTVVLCLFFANHTAIAGPLANNNKPGTYARSIEQILRYNSKDIDIGTAAMIISEQWSENVLGREYIFELDKMAHKILNKIEERGGKVDFTAVKVINEYLYDELGFTTTKSADDPEDLFLHSVVDRRRGYCLSLSILYLSLAERIGLELHGVVAPGHFFIRYDDGVTKFNIETTSKGAITNDAHYIQKFNPPADNDVYMRNLDKRETLGCFFNNLGNSYERVGDLEMAVKALENAIEINPALAESRTNLANIYMKQGDNDSAIELYETAIEMNPNSPKVYCNLANAYVNDGKISKAIDLYKHSLELDPELAYAYMNLGRAYLINRDYDEALAQLIKAQTLSDQNPTVYFLLAEVYLKKDRIADAIYNYEKTIKLKPDHSQAYYSLATCYNMNGNIDNEIYYYKKALSIDPEMTAAIVNLGNAYFAQEDYNSAVSLYKKAIKLIKNDDRIYYNLGAAYTNLQLYPQAIEQYLAALAINPQNAEAHNGLAFLYYTQEKYNTAWKHIQKARQFGYPVDPNLLKAIQQRL